MTEKTVSLKPLYQVFANRIHWLPTNAIYRAEREAELRRLSVYHMPSGSGFDCGTFIDLEKSTGTKLVFRTAFHHMDEHGGYTCWTDHLVTATPSFMSPLTLQVSGKNKNNIKEYIYEVFFPALLQLVSTGASIVPSSEERENVDA